MKTRILLVRHMLSASNVDKRENLRTADHAIPGVAPEQGLAAGKFLGEWILGNLVREGMLPRTRLWHSPYLRTRMTAATIQQACRLPEGVELKRYPSPQVGLHHDVHILPRIVYPGQSFFVDDDASKPVPHAREDILLAEQQFGLFDGLTDDECKLAFPHEFEHYHKTKKAQGKMWARMPQGESRADVCLRLRTFFGSLHRDMKRHNIDTAVIVGHGTTNRAFATMWMHKPYEWMHEEVNPLNCSIRLIEDGELHPENNGYIFPGFESPGTN